MKKYLLIILFLCTFFLQLPFLGKLSVAHAQNPPAAIAPAGNAPAAPGTAVAPGAGPAATAPAAAGATPLAVGAAAPPPDGAWLTDSDVTFAGKNAARSRDLFNWVLTNYQWSTDDNTLIAFWAKIRNVVYIFLVLLVMVTAFLMIITGGQSFTAIQFIRKFLLVIILITFSFAIIRIFYQIIDVIQLFFIKNPDGKIISSVDLLNISFKYEDFVGYRKYGPSYDESAFMSLLLTKLTAATYFVMAGVLIVRKVILWFFITVSPIYPILLLYFPVRNTAKIWIGEFFRWLLYAPLFAIFLSGLVVLWRQNINVLPFNFDAAGAQPTIVYPTAINILLGGPGQKLGIANSINYKDTFAEYIVALIMLWVVIFLPFLLLRIFLDYFSSMSVNNNSAWKYITSNANKILPSNDFFPNKNQPTPPSTPPPPPSFYPTGAARELPMPTGTARSLPLSRPAATTYQSSVRQQSNVRQQTIQTSVSKSTATPVYKSQNTSVATSQLVNFSIPTMRDVAKYETSRISSQTSTRQETTKVNDTLQKIANPQSITNPVERQQFNQIKEKLVQAQKQGDPLATSILNAASHVTNKTTVSNVSNTKVSQATNNLSQVTQQATTQIQQTLQKMSNTQSITNVTEKQQVTQLSEKLTQESKQGNSYATTMLSTINHMSSQSSQQTSSQVQQIVQKLANPESVKNVTERQQINKLKETLKQEKEKGNNIAGNILSAADKVQEAQEATEAAQSGMLPETNQVQTVNLEDYEEVKKTWTENYQKLDVPKSLDNPEQTREQWIKKDLADTTHTIDLLSSQDVQKVKEGMSEVSALLPFLLVGGFSQAEIVAYLQAKKHAAEKVLAETQQSKQDEDTLLETTKRHAESSMHLEEELPDNDNKTHTLGEEKEDDVYEDSPLYKATHEKKEDTTPLNDPLSQQEDAKKKFEVEDKSDNSPIAQEGTEKNS